MQFSFTLLDAFQETNDTLYGCVHPDRLFLSDAVPNGALEDWILWTLLSHKHNTKDEGFASSRINGNGMLMLPGFLEGTWRPTQDLPQPTLSWTQDEKTIRGFHTIDKPSTFLKRRHLQPVVSKNVFMNKLGGNWRDTPNDITCMEGGLLLGALDGLHTISASHPVFALFTLLDLFLIPNEPFFPRRTNRTGWESVFSGFSLNDPEDVTGPVLTWALDNQILLPTNLLSSDTFKLGARFGITAEYTRSWASRGLGYMMVELAEQHAHTIASVVGHRRAFRQAQAAYRVSRTDDYTFQPQSAHEALAWESLHKGLLALVAKQGPLGYIPDL